jgi:DNA-binding response OmpR family regulator
MKSEKRILIVDDDDAIRALLSTVLKRRGLRVDTARNGVEAVAKLGERRYSLMLLDLMMPLMSGYQVLEHLGDESAASRPLVLILTAGLEPRHFDTTLVVGTIHKPFDVELLVDTVIGCLTVSQTVAEESPRTASLDTLPTENEKPN